MSSKQLVQVNNILNTLIEATEHFHGLVKEKEFNQSIYIFSSIVDGFGAISKVDYPFENSDWENYKLKVENYFLNIAQQLENANLVKVSEILQFSLLPQLKKMSDTVFKDLGVNEESKTITIGVFSSATNPRNIYPEDRLNALIQESIKQNSKLLFFSKNDVDFENKTVIADIYDSGKWVRQTVPFPDVINNVGGVISSHTERKLRRVLPFTSFFVGNKVSLPKRIVQYRTYAELLVPFILCSNKAKINHFLDKNNKVVFKYLNSNRGENIFFVTKKGNRYILLEHKKERILSQETFDSWVESVILKEPESFIVQKYIHTRTKSGEPYHIRAHVQKNGEGQWVLTHIYPRIGNKKSNLSNVATEGRIEDFHSFLIKEYGEQTGTTYEQKILKLSIDLAHHIDKLYDLGIDELGIDFAIDDNGRIWMHEANNGPQTAFHEEKRAKNTIAYAKYIAKNGIFHTDYFIKSAAGMFLSRNSNLEYASLNNLPTIGILTDKIEENNLLDSFASEVTNANINLFAFKPLDIDYEEMLIRGYFFEDGKWVAKLAKYPDIIIDHIKLRNDHNGNWIYEEFEDIPFTNKWSSRLYNRSDIYSSLISQLDNNNQISFAPYDKVNKTRDIFKYLEEYGKVILNPEIGYSALQFIQKNSNGKYQITNAKLVKEYSELQLMNKLKEQITEKN
ncbi:YheC/YheD family protein [Ornithinibacillus scapharcae]|uniref:YheC/YheD family protein n=1 Tax=Ornithinibacillus scapharcae TaxID=1147159 RepID=UPI000225B7EA|nr:YheC/YheD family protein [Ornithinibacillus scapharcae]